MMMTQKELLIEARNLGKTFYRKNSSPMKALEQVNMGIHKGEFLVIVGRSGSGKTTLLNLLGTLDRPTTGEIRYRDVNLSKFSNQDLAVFRRDKIGFIFQTFNLLPSLTVLENVESALIHSLMTRKQAHSKISTLLHSLDLVGLSGRLPLELSVGQQQKVAIARALAKDPSLILADEPTGEMDPMAGKEIWDRLLELNRKSGITVVVASHAMPIFSKPDRLIFIKDGKIVSKEESGY